MRPPNSTHRPVSEARTRKLSRADRGKRGTLLAIENGLYRCGYRSEAATDRWLLETDLAEVVPGSEVVLAEEPSAPRLSLLRLTRKGRAELARLGSGGAS